MRVSFDFSSVNYAPATLRICALSHKYQYGSGPAAATLLPADPAPLQLPPLCRLTTAAEAAATTKIAGTLIE